MLDYHLAEMYDVETKYLNRVVKRNLERFPERFMFQLVSQEVDSLRCQFGTAKNEQAQYRRFLPYVFTEQGVAMLSAVLRSETAVRVSIQIMQAFVEMRHLLLNNTHLQLRVSNIENKQIEHEHKFDELFKALEKNQLKATQGIFFDGQVFDAYSFVSDLIRSANKSIILLDNYIDDTVLCLFAKKKKNVDVTVFTKITKLIKQDIEKFNSQYPFIRIKDFEKSHDRFLIIDNEKIYHIGASLKDLGKKWFAFSLMKKESVATILNKLR